MSASVLRFEPRRLGRKRPRNDDERQALRAPADRTTTTRNERLTQDDDDDDATFHATERSIVKYPIRSRVLKYFDGLPYRGVVTRYTTSGERRPWYHVVYEDDDEEDVDEKEMDEIVVIKDDDEEVEFGSESSTSSSEEMDHSCSFAAFNRKKRSDEEKVLNVPPKTSEDEEFFSSQYRNKNPKTRIPSKKPTNNDETYATTTKRKKKKKKKKKKKPNEVRDDGSFDTSKRRTKTKKQKRMNEDRRESSSLAASRSHRAMTTTATTKPRPKTTNRDPRAEESTVRGGRVATKVPPVDASFEPRTATATRDTPLDSAPQTSGHRNESSFAGTRCRSFAVVPKGSFDGARTNAPSDGSRRTLAGKEPSERQTGKGTASTVNAVRLPNVGKAARHVDLNATTTKGWGDFKIPKKRTMGGSASHHPTIATTRTTGRDGVRALEKWADAPQPWNRARTTNTVVNAFATTPTVHDPKTTNQTEATPRLSKVAKGETHRDDRASNAATTTKRGTFESHKRKSGLANVGTDHIDGYGSNAFTTMTTTTKQNTTPLRTVRAARASHPTQTTTTTTTKWETSNRTLDAPHLANVEYNEVDVGECKANTTPSTVRKTSQPSNRTSDAPHSAIVGTVSDDRTASQTTATKRKITWWDPRRDVPKPSNSTNDRTVLKSLLKTPMRWTKGAPKRALEPPSPKNGRTTSGDEDQPQAVVTAHATSCMTPGATATTTTPTSEDIESKRLSERKHDAHLSTTACPSHDDRTATPNVGDESLFRLLRRTNAKSSTVRASSRAVRSHPDPVAAVRVWSRVLRTPPKNHLPLLYVAHEALRGDARDRDRGLFRAFENAWREDLGYVREQLSDEEAAQKVRRLVDLWREMGICTKGWRTATLGAD